MKLSKFHERYSRQMVFSPIGENGQKKLINSKVTIIGCGGLGSNIINNLARSGVGFIRIIDKDKVELSNLQRQLLFDEKDVELKTPKVVAAREKLGLINSSVEIEAVVDEVNKKNIQKYIEKTDLVLDGTDNFDIRYLINETCIKNNIPWIYGSVAASYGIVCNILPESEYCLRCIFKELPTNYIGASAGNAGILNSVVSVVASLQTTEALKLLTGNSSSMIKGLIVLDVWELSLEIVEIEKNSKCLACS